MTWALRSLCRPSTKAHLLTTGQGPMVVLPGGSCVLSGGGSAGGVHPLPEYMFVKHPTSCAGYIPVHCLLLLLVPINES